MARIEQELCQDIELQGESNSATFMFLLCVFFSLS